MVKSKLITAIAQKKATLSEKSIELSVNQILDAMSQSLIHNDRVEIRGFGSFKLNHHPPRKARNPKTGNLVTTPGKYSPYFRPGRELRLRVIEAAQSGKAIIIDQDSAAA